MSGVRLPARWVRWKEFVGWSNWHRCISVRFDGPWLIVDLLGGPLSSVAVPDHIVRGQVEISHTHNEAGPSTTPPRSSASPAEGTNAEALP